MAGKVWCENYARRCVRAVVAEFACYVAGGPIFWLWVSDFSPPLNFDLSTFQALQLGPVVGGPCLGHLVWSVSPIWLSCTLVCPAHLVVPKAGGATKLDPTQQLWERAVCGQTPPNCGSIKLSAPFHSPIHLNCGQKFLNINTLFGWRGDLERGTFFSSNHLMVQKAQILAVNS